nr:hypothetical protein CFP56_28240 [Quercus suber]
MSLLAQPLLGGQKLAAVERAQNSTNHKVEVLKGKLEKSDTKLAQALSVVTTRGEELGAMKKRLKEAGQTYNDLDFDDVKCYMAKFIKKASLVGFMEGWVAFLDTIPLPDTSLYRDLSKVPLPEDPLVKEVRQKGETTLVLGSSWRR